MAALLFAHQSGHRTLTKIDRCLMGPREQTNTGDLGLTAGISWSHAAIASLDSRGATANPTSSARASVDPPIALRKATRLVSQLPTGLSPMNFRCDRVSKASPAIHRAPSD